MQVSYDNTTGLLGVIGDPIAHSLSPLLQNTMLERLGENRLYLAFRVPPDGIAAWIAAAKTIGIGGFNLTMPHKETVIPYLDSMTSQARRCASVNTVRLQGGKLEGHSTDGIGFLRSMQDFGFEPAGKTVTVLGAGGAAKSIVKAMGEQGAATVYVANRTPARAESIVEGEAGMRALPISEVGDVLPETDLLVSTLPLGMEGVAGSVQLPELEKLRKGALCADCIYAPAMTPFMLLARGSGHAAVNGIGMLIYQAIYALAFFLHREFSEEEVTELGRALYCAAGIDPKGESAAAE